VTVWNLFGRI